MRGSLRLEPGSAGVGVLRRDQYSAAGFRLPTEAQWERAARSITQTRFCYGDVLECGDVCEPCPTHDQHMVYCSTNTEYAGSRMANGFGIHDLHGNVWELVQDWYEANLGGSHVIDPTGPTSGFDRVIRGGGWAYSAHQARSANRNEYPMSSRGADVGFRLARPVQ